MGWVGASVTLLIKHYQATTLAKSHFVSTLKCVFQQIAEWTTRSPTLVIKLVAHISFQHPTMDGNGRYLEL